MVLIGAKFQVSINNVPSIGLQIYGNEQELNQPVEQRHSALENGPEKQALYQ